MDHTGIPQVALGSWSHPRGDGDHRESGQSQREGPSAQHRQATAAGIVRGTDGRRQRAGPVQNGPDEEEDHVPVPHLVQRLPGLLRFGA